MDGRIAADKQAQVDLHYLGEYIQGAMAGVADCLRRIEGYTAGIKAALEAYNEKHGGG